MTKRRNITGIVRGLTTTTSRPEHWMSLKQIALRYLPESVLKSVRTRHYQNQLKHYPLSEEPDLLGCKALLRPGDTVLDVGACIGVYTRFCSEFVGPTGQVHSMEPMPETFSYLSSNIRALGLNNVTLYNLAASDKVSDHAAMSMPQYSSGGANIYEATLSDHGDIPIKTTRLDTLFPNLSPRLIKCDVEGHEAACINGALELIARCRPRWVVEISNPKIFEIFASLSYDPFVYEQGSFRPAAPTDNVPNFFFFPREDSPASKPN